MGWNVAEQRQKIYMTRKFNGSKSRGDEQVEN